jgi:DtxR family Mn-dependent transcriptional regulator
MSVTARSDEATTPSPVAQRYLEAFARLGRKNKPVPLTAIARRVGVSAPTAHEMMRRLSDGGYITRSGERGGWYLTTEGRLAAAAVRRRRSVVEHFLRTVLMLDEDQVAEEADRLLFSVSPNLEKELRRASWPGEKPCEKEPIVKRFREHVA